jgi:hypothetical protein
MCLCIVTNIPWYVSNRQIHEDLGILFFTNLWLKFSQYWEPLSSATWEALVPTKGWLNLTMGNRGGLMLSRSVEAALKSGAKSMQWLVYNTSHYPDWGFPYISSVITQMLVCNWVRGMAHILQSWKLSAKMVHCSKSQWPSAKVIPSLLGSSPIHPSNQGFFVKGKFPDRFTFLSVTIAPSLNMSRPSAKKTNPLQ